GNADRNDDMMVSSEGKIETDNKFQTSNITINIWASVIFESHTQMNTLKFKVKVKNCGVSKFLSKQCTSLGNFVCYYIDSLEIDVSPIPVSPNHTFNIIMLKEMHPKRPNRVLELSYIRENGYHTKIGVVGYGTPMTTGAQWSYRFASSEIRNSGDRRDSVRTNEIHFGHWYIKNEMKGFRITVIQVLGFKKKSNFFLKKLIRTPELLMQYPKLVHKLEISFENIADFNDYFAELTKRVYTAPSHTLETSVNISHDKIHDDAIILRAMTTLDDKM
ncbi:6887_t:CDS:2, partial [Cetraspora pellucida]